MKKHNYKLVDPYLVGFHPDFLAEDWVKSKEKLTLWDAVNPSQALEIAKDALFLVFATSDSDYGNPRLEVIGPDGGKHCYTLMYSSTPGYPEFAEKNIFIPINVSADSEP